MSSIKRVWSILTVLTLAIIIHPSAGHAMQVDPFGSTTLLGVVSLQYERFRSDQYNFTDKTDTFQQQYSLEILGQVLSRRIMNYNMGVGWTDVDYKTNSSERKTRTLDYYLTTTLLPLSKIPLTIYGDRIETDTTGTGERSDSRTKFGLKWLMNFRTLPKTRIDAERRINDLSGTETLETTFKLDMEKDLGPTENMFIYSLETKDNTTSNNPYEQETLQHIFQFTNTTHISKSTLFSIGGTRGIQKHPKAVGQDATITGLGASFTSHPSADFEQSHHYTFFSNRTDDGQDNTGHFYGGDMKYWIADNLRSSLDLSIEKRKDDTTTSYLDLDSLSTSFSLDYFPTDNLTLSELLTYNDYKVNTNNPDTISTGDHSEFSALSRARYTRPLDWARMSLQYSVGYTEKAISNEGSGAGIDQEISGGLGAIDINRFVGFDTTARYRYLEGISGDIWEKDTEFRFDAYNKEWLEYVEVLASYNRFSQDGWANILNRTSEVYNLRGKTEFMNNTKVLFNAETGSTYDEVNKDVDYSAADISAVHNRMLFKGMLNLSARYGIRSTKTTDQTLTTTSTDYLASYGRRLTFNLGWKLTAERNEETTKDPAESFSNTTSLDNILIYRLRAWLFAFEHRYSITEDNIRERTDNYLMLRATRKFVRFL